MGSFLIITLTFRLNINDKLDFNTDLRGLKLNNTEFIFNKSQSVFLFW